MPNQLLPQSALPLGQSPLAAVQGPRVGNTLPGPLDTTSFFRMQQAQQANVSLLQRNEALKLQRQQLDLQEYELMIRDTDSILGMVSNAFTDAYESHTRSSGQKSSAMGGFGLLDPSKPMHAQIIQRNQGIIDSARAQMDQVGLSYLNSGSKDPGTRYETIRQMRNVINETNAKLANDPDFVRYTTQERNFNTWWDQLAAYQAQGKNINAESVDMMLEKYRTFTDEGRGQIRTEDWRIDKYVYDAPKALTSIAADAKNLGLGTEEFAQIGIGDGGALKGTQTTRRSLDEITNILVDKYKADPNAMALYNNTAKDVMSFRDWIKLQAQPHAPLEGKEVTVIAESGSPIIKPGSKSSGGGQTSSFESVIQQTLGSGQEATTDERKIIGRERDLWKLGFDNTDISYTDWLEINRISEKGTDLIEMRYVDEKGKPVSDYKKAARVEYWEKQSEIDGEPRPITSAGKRGDVLEYEENIAAGLISVTPSAFQDEGIGFGIQGRNHFLSKKAFDLLKEIPSEFNNANNSVTSTYRNEEKNRSVGGSPNSYHKRGHAIDIDYVNEEGKAFGQWVESEQGKAWLQERGYSGEIHDKGQPNEHVHLQPLPIYDTSTAPGENPTRETTIDTVEGTRKAAVMKPEEQANYILNSILVGNQDLDLEDVQFMFDNPPERLTSVIQDLKQKYDELPKLQRQYKELRIKSELQGLTSKEEEKLEDVARRVQGIEDSNSVLGIREALLPIIAREQEAEIMQEFIDRKILDTPPGEIGELVIPYNDKMVGGYRIRRSDVDDDFYAVEAIKGEERLKGEKERGIVTQFRGDFQIMNREELKEMLNRDSRKFAEEVVNSLFNPADIEEVITRTAADRINEYNTALEQRKAILLEREAAKKANENVTPDSNKADKYR